MPDLADLFPGYASEWINTRSGRIFARVGGKGPPLLLLHGFSETHVMWHRVAPKLADQFTLIVADLPGYGWSDMPESDKDHTPYTKRAMAKVMVEAMEQLGHVHFALADHDRGGRVSYRLALDHPGRLSKLAVLDILPTYNYWERMNRLYALKIYHWTFLAQPYPLPETLISGHPDFFLKETMASQTKPARSQGLRRANPAQVVVRGSIGSPPVSTVLLLVWTAPGGIECARLRSLLLISDKGDRPWNRLAELGWIRRSTFFSYMG